MSDIKVKQLSEYIDKKINSKKNQNKESDAILDERIKLEDEDSVEVVQKLLQQDFSDMSKIKDVLKKRLIEQMQSQNTDRIDDDELDFEDLDRVAGGLSRRNDELKKSDE